MPTIKTKFKCEKVTETETTQTVQLGVVIDGNADNDTTFKFTPAGKMEINIIDPEATFLPGREYTMEFTIIPTE